MAEAVKPQDQRDHLHPALRRDVRLLGELLGDTEREQLGDRFISIVERTRRLAKDTRSQAEPDWNQLSDWLGEIPESDVINLARAFNQFLNLANLADQQHQVTVSQDAASERNGWLATFSSLLDEVDEDSLWKTLQALSVELVLTAHPTEILRRTLIQKYDAIAGELANLRSGGDQLRNQTATRLRRLIAEAWHSDEIRHHRPTPQDEARWGFTVIEHSLWQAVPESLRTLDEICLEKLGKRLPPSVTPITFAAWMGGDRDGNPNVTAAVTREVLLLARWMAADLFARDIEVLNASLSMTECTLKLRRLVGDDAREPYRKLLNKLRNQLYRTRDWLGQRLAGSAGKAPEDLLLTKAQLLEPLHACYESLIGAGMRVIADGPLLDTLRRAHVFGVNLVRLDLRQSADRHTEAMHEIVDYLGLGREGRGYKDWNEDERIIFLVEELLNPRPLLPADWQASSEVQEVLDTCRLLVADTGDGISQYVVSMASSASDLLTVLLLLKASGFRGKLPVVPLFETLDDLNSAPEVLRQLLNIDWYREHISGYQQIMIGYSDSAKDAGQLAAAWAQYQAVEKLVAVARDFGIRLIFFHGRGGAVGRGGGPAREAILSQPPGSVAGALRVTEQGEMIRFKLGLPGLARDTIGRYLRAVMEVTLAPPPEPEPEWRQAMQRLATTALQGYRRLVQGDGFVELFHALTPAAELSSLALGSRPARRRATADISGLRAIPWVFSWTQVRLMLPAWLGTDLALEQAIARKEEALLRAMLSWPFFRMQMDMLEMVLTKADPDLTRYYASRLVSPGQMGRAMQLADRLGSLVTSLLVITGADELMQANPHMRASIEVRNTYLDPLHLLQTELLMRLRLGTQVSDDIAQALKVTMAGIASGLRNTG